MISVTYHADLNEVQGGPALAGLMARATTPFDRPAFWRGLVEDCGLRPLIAVAREDDEIALLPLARTDHPRRLAALANWYSFRTAPLITPGGAALLAEIARDLACKASRVTLYPVPNEGGEADLLAAAFAATGWLVRREEADINHILPVSGRSYADYLAARPGALRSTIRRKAGKVAISLHQHFDAALWAEYQAVYAASWKPGEGSPAFLARFAREEAEAGRLRLAIARLPDSGRPVAAQMWTVEHGIAYIHKLAYAEDAKPLSPGTSLSAALFEQVIDRDRVDLVDFGTGDDAYKRDWMEAARPRYRLTLTRPLAPREWPQIASKCVKRLAGGLRHG